MRALRRRYGHGKYRRSPVGWRGPVWYRYSVLYRDTPGGPVKQEIVESTSRENAIVAVQMMYPHAVDLAATQASTRPLP